jgi:predicted nucleic acid-binding protein
VRSRAGPPHREPPRQRSSAPRSRKPAQRARPQGLLDLASSTVQAISRRKSLRGELIVLDTSVVLAFMNRNDTSHEAVRDWLAVNRAELVTTPLVLAELDHLVERYGGATATRALRQDLTNRAYQVEWWTTATHETLSIAETHQSMQLGLTDSSLLALAAHTNSSEIATLDERHFRTVRQASGDAFTLLPTDASQ